MFQTPRHTGRTFVRDLKVAALTLAVVFLAAYGGSDGATAASNPSGSGSAAGLQSLIEAAKKEGQIVWYNGLTAPQAKAVTDGFTKKYGIKVQTFTQNTGLLEQRLANEIKSGVHTADVFLGAATRIFDDNPSWFMKLDERTVPGYDAYPKNAKGANYAITIIYLAGFQYNTDLVKEADVPDSWAALADPKWRGKLLFTDPTSSPTYMGWVALMHKTLGTEYLTNLAKQKMTLADSATTAAQKIAAGAYAISFPAAASHSSALSAQGAPIKFKTINTPSTGPMSLMSIPAAAPHPAAARLFLSYTLSAEAQDGMCQVTPIVGPNPGTSKCISLPSSWVPLPSDVWRDAAKEAPLLNALGVKPNK